MAPAKVKSFTKFAKCKTALEAKRAEYLATEKQTTRVVSGVEITNTPVVDEIRLVAREKAVFRFTMQTSSFGPAREDGLRPGGRWAIGVDWTCDGKDLWKQEQSGAYVTVPLPPMPPKTPTAQ